MSWYGSQYLNEDYVMDSRFCYYTEYKSFDLKYDSHIEGEIMGVVEGECTIPLQNRNVVLRSGSLIFLDGGTVHGLLIQTPCRMFCVKFELKKAACSGLSFREVAQSEKCLAELLERKRPYYVLRDREHIDLIVRDLVFSQSNSGPLYRQLLLYEILVKLSRQLSGNSFQTLANNDGALYVQKAGEFIESHFDGELSLGMIASYMGLNPSYFGRLFKNRTGLTPMEYVTRCRLDRAKLLLESTSLPIIDICNQVGLTSRQYFGKLFKAREGLSPGVYRSRNKRQN